MRPKLRSLLIRIQELKVKGLQNVKIARKDKAGLHGPGGNLPVRTGITLPVVAAQRQPVATPLNPVPAPLNPLPAMLRNIQVYWQYNVEPPVPFAACKGIVTFNYTEELGTTEKFDRFIRCVIKTYSKWLQTARHAEDISIKDPD